jgi:regulator of replication initiation timing
MEDAQPRITQLSAENEKINREWKLKNDMLWEQLIQFENKVRTLTSEKQQLERTVHEIVEQTTKESEKLCRELGHRALERFDWRAEMDVLRESLVKHHVCPAEHFKPGFRMPLSTYVDDVIQTIVDSIQEIEKTEPIMNLFYCSFDDFEFGEPVSNTMVYPGIVTYAKVYLMTSKLMYELQGYLKGKPSGGHGIYLHSAVKQYEVKNLEYGTFYRFHPIAEVHSDVNWSAVSMLIRATKGNIGRAVNRTYSLSHDEQSHLQFGINISSGHMLKQTAERYITNVIHAVTMAQ